jgi:ATP-dependent Clp protease ATP-binding subunit ClpC
MFERFTDRARRAMALAQEEAQRHHSGVGTEHLLLGLIQEGEGVAAKALEALGISLETVSQQIQEIIGPAKPPPSGHSRFSPRAKQVLKLSLREALQLGHHYIGTEHLLLGLMREGEGVAAQVLVKLGADLSGVRQQVIQLLQGNQGQEEPEAGRTAPRPGGARPGRARPGQPGTLAEILRGVESIDSRLSAMEQSVGAGPEVRDLDEQIAQAARDKESAAGAEDYEHAAQLRDRERQLLAEKSSRQAEWAAAHLDLSSLAEGLHRVGDEVRQLRELLRRRGADRQDGAA